MREIKFRGIDANGVMRYGRLSQDKPNETSYWKEYSQRICWDNSNIPVKNETLGQFTGLKDKNGKEIYEGDIVRISDNHTEVINWIGDGDWMGEKQPLVGFIHHASIYKKPIEVIGNLYENPNLLSQDE